MLNTAPFRFSPASSHQRARSGPALRPPPFVQCSPAILGTCQVQQQLLALGSLQNPRRSVHRSLTSICSTAASAGDLTASQPESSGEPKIAANASQPRADSKPGFLYNLFARFHMEARMREQDYMQSMTSVWRHLFARARDSNARSVLLSWLGLPFLLNYLNVRFFVQLLAGFHRERLIRLRLLRWVARRSAVLKLSKASQADPASADK